MRNIFIECSICTLLTLLQPNQPPLRTSALSPLWVLTWLPSTQNAPYPFFFWLTSTPAVPGNSRNRCGVK